MGRKLQVAVAGDQHSSWLGRPPHSEPDAQARALARRFTRAPRDRVAELLDTLVSLGQAREVNGDKYAS